MCVCVMETKLYSGLMPSSCKGTVIKARVLSCVLELLAKRKKKYIASVAAAAVVILLCVCSWM